MNDESSSNAFCLSAREEERESIEYRSHEESGRTLMDTPDTDNDDETTFDQSPVPELSTPKTSEVGMFGGSTNNGGGSECVEFPAGESSELLSVGHDDPGSTPGLDRCRSKWVKLRSTIKVACALTPTTRRRPQLERQDSFLKRFSTRQAGSQYAAEDSSVGGDGQEPERRQSKGAEVRLAEKFVINPDESFMFGWLTGIACAVLYNLWTCIAREAFQEIRSGFEPLWYTADGLCDLIYLLDIVVQLRTGFLERGLIVYDSVKLMKHYVYSRDFVLDLVSLAPLDLVQIYVGVHPILRFPRFVKSYRLYRFVYMVETRTAFPNMWRVANLSHVLFLGCHWFAAFYFLISRAENFRTGWGYPAPVGEYASVTQKYLRSLYWSTLTLTTIGDLQSPESNWEFAFTITSYLIGVFVFATIVGQVGNVITNQNACRQEFERHLDGAKAYMRYHNVPRDMQQRVQRWYDYAWSRGRINGGGDINALGLLPDKLKTELALHVNLETLRKVAIFNNCEPEFLHDLVLKMKAYIFTPRDLICRKGEVAREMFIIADGLVEVVSDSGEVLKQMAAGDFFGEIGILNLDGGVNRRTADVRSLGYSELFVLSRDDVLAALKDHPEAEILIKEYGQIRLRELDEHKKRRLCERLAKELSTSNTESTASTVGKMVLSTGLLHGIGVAASAGAKGEKSCQGQGVTPRSRSRTLPNGSSRTGVDEGEGRWANFVGKIKGNGENSASISVQRNRSNTNTEKETSGQERTSFPVLSLQSDEPGSKLGRTRKAALPEASAVGLSSCRQNVVGRRPGSLQGVRELPIARRLAGMFGRRKNVQSRPGKLWSLGAVNPQLSSLATKPIASVEDSSTISTPGDNPKPEPTNAPTSVAHAQCGPAVVPVPSSGFVAQSANSISKSLDTSNRKGEGGEEIDVATRNVDVSGRGRSEVDTGSLGLSVPPTPSGRTSKTASDCDDLGSTMTMGRPDFQAICSDLSDMIREFVHAELVAMQMQYSERLRSLEDEIAQKESLIVRLRKELSTVKTPLA